MVDRWQLNGNYNWWYVITNKLGRPFWFNITLCIRPTLVDTQELSSPTLPSSLFQHSTRVVIRATHSLVVSCTAVHRVRNPTICNESKVCTGIYTPRKKKHYGIFCYRICVVLLSFCDQKNPLFCYQPAAVCFFFCQAVISDEIGGIILTWWTYTIHMCFENCARVKVSQIDTFFLNISEIKIKMCAALVGKYASI